MLEYHNQTNHTYNSVRKNSTYLDWNSKPRDYKLYPYFYYRVDLNKTNFKELNLIGGISCKKVYGNSQYYLRTVPSAGALYPSEVYIQIRGVEGFFDGIYHYEPLNAKFTLLKEISSDGVEEYLNINKQNGFIFLISSIYFRSSWKYKNRAIRYILLDSGHQLGSIYATLKLMGRDSELVFDFEKELLNESFGFFDFEMFLVAITSSITVDNKIKKLSENLPFVAGSDYLEENKFIIDSYKSSLNYKDTNLTNLPFLSDVSEDDLNRAIFNRRSIRAFKREAITLEEFEFIFKDIFEFATTNGLELFYSVHNVVGLENGLYKNRDLIEVCDFREKSKYLSLEQHIGGDSALTLYFTSNDSCKYQKVNILSGFLAHIIYLKAEVKNIGVSGIGAYYDDEVKNFLDTENNILYLLSIGR